MNRLWIVPRRASKHVELPAVATPRDKGGAESTFYFCVAWQYNRQDYTSGVSSVALCIRAYTLLLQPAAHGQRFHSAKVE